LRAQKLTEQAALHESAIGTASDIAAQANLGLRSCLRMRAARAQNIEESPTAT
jgi:hypothetical protein